MRTQRKENYYYIFWTVAIIAFIVPQVFTAYAYMTIKDLLDKPINVEVVDSVKIGFQWIMTLKDYIKEPRRDWNTKQWLQHAWVQRWNPWISEEDRQYWRDKIKELS